MADIDHFDDGSEEDEPQGGLEDADDTDAGEPLILVVVGAHLRAEVGDRPLGYLLRDRMAAWLREKFGAVAEGPDAEGETGDEPDDLPCGVAVCTDVLYLNDVGLRVWPTVSIGGPGVNALSAFLADKLPSVFVIDDVLMVQMDLEGEQASAAVWGINHTATVSALEAFLERYLEPFMAAATKGWGE